MPTSGVPKFAAYLSPSEVGSGCPRLLGVSNLLRGMRVSITPSFHSV
jgi:hypothetical protein